MVEDASGSRVAGSQEPAHVEPSSKPQFWARLSGPWAYTGGGSESGGPTGPTPRHNALRPMSVTCRGPRRRSLLELERGQGYPRPRRSPNRGIFDRGTLPCSDSSGAEPWR
jgi:hypothetical protein